MSSINDISQLTYKLGTDLIPKNIPKFHKQMLEFWFEFFSVEPSTMQEILNEKLCLNKFILIQGRPIGENYNLVKKTGITNLGQLVNKNTFKTIRQLEAEYSCSLSQFQLNSLLSAIPSSWKKNLKDRTDFITGPLYDLPGMRINIPKLTNKKIYEILTFSKASPSAENKWVKYYPFLETINWSDIYSLCSLVTTNSKLRSLQYNIVHRIFCCNYNLYLWKIVEKSDCWYCNEVDTLEHYFFSCEQSKIMWKEVEKIIHNTLGLKISLTVLKILLGIPCKNIRFTMF